VREAVAVMVGTVESAATRRTICCTSQLLLQQQKLELT
jgi:hypothetical protein